jgi:hypothetical protein
MRWARPASGNGSWISAWPEPLHAEQSRPKTLPVPAHSAHSSTRTGTPYANPSAYSTSWKFFAISDPSAGRRRATSSCCGIDRDDLKSMTWTAAPCSSNSA